MFPQPAINFLFVVTAMNSNSRLNVSRLILVLSVSMLAACAGSGKNTVLRPEAQVRAVNLLERGLRAQQKGDTLQAEGLLREALASSSSIEDNQTKIVVLVNLARLNRLKGSLDMAGDYIDSALQLYTEYPELMAEVAYEKAHIEFVLNNNKNALQWAGKALDDEKKSLKGVRRNLLARIQLAVGNRAEAILSATSARQENRLNGLSEEEANSVRMLGTIELDEGRAAAAGALIREALEIDKRNGASVKIGLDLETLADVADVMGDLKIRGEYLERACTVYLADGHREKADLILEKLSDLNHKIGDVGRKEKFRRSLEQLKPAELPYPDSAAERAKPSSKP